MTCNHCGKPVTNWPAWLEDPAVKVCCHACAASEPDTVNLPSERMTFTPLAMASEPVLELAEAA